jgi:putative Ca2+/H+ antiporter (TMEM165/GDT1 family)
MGFKKERSLEALFISTSIVALAETGDETQLLSFILTAKFKSNYEYSL